MGKSGPGGGHFKESMKKIILTAVLAALLSSCGYYNTFYNARKYYNESEYNMTLEKCEKLLSKEKYSKLHDDALFYKGKAYVGLRDYNSAIDAYETMVNDFPDSKYVREAQKELFQLYFSRNELGSALKYIHVFDDEGDIAAIDYAKILFVTGKRDKLKQLSDRKGDKTDTGLEIAVYSALAFHDDDRVTALIGRFSSEKKREEMAEKVFIHSLNSELLNYMSEKSRTLYQPVADCLKKETGKDQLIENLKSFDELDDEYTILLTRKLYEYFLNSGQYEFARFTALKVQSLLEAEQEQNYAVTLSNTFSQIKYMDQPNDVEVYFTDGKDFYIYDKDQQLFSIQNGMWEQVIAEEPPRTVSSYENLIWNSLNRRWVMFDHDDTKWDALNKKDLTWSTINVEGDELPLMNKKNIYTYSRNIYYFAGVDRYYRMYLEGSDRVVVTEKKISGTLPNITGYTVLDLTRYNYLALIGGKSGESINYSVYFLNLNDENPKWEEKYVDSPVLMSNYVWVPYASRGRIILYYWDSSDYDEVKGALSVSFKSEDVSLDIYKIQGDFKTIPKFFYYENDLSSTRTNFIHYMDTTAAYNQLLIYQYAGSISYKTDNTQAILKRGGLNNTQEEKNVDLIFIKSGESVDLREEIKALAAISRVNVQDPRSEKEIGDLMISGIKRPLIAMGHYERYIEREPRDVQVLYALAFLNYKYTGDTEKAAAYLDRFFQAYEGGSGILLDKAEGLKKVLQQ